MSDLLEILSILVQFFAFVVLATAVIIIPLVAVLWSSELFSSRKKTPRRAQRAAIAAHQSRLISLRT